MKRETWIDFAKGVGIILVIMAHTSGNDSMRAVINAFHMPLFFFLSGYTFKVSNLSIRNKIIKCVKRYLYPYVIWSAVTIIGIGILGTWYYDIRSGLAFDNILINVKSMLNDTVLGYGIGALWFLSAMFFTKI